MTIQTQTEDGTLIYNRMEANMTAHVRIMVVAVAVTIG